MPCAFDPPKVKLATNEPSASPEPVVSSAPWNETVMVELAINPSPETETSTALESHLQLRDIDGVVTSNVLDAIALDPAMMSTYPRSLAPDGTLVVRPRGRRPAASDRIEAPPPVQEVELWLKQTV